MSIWSRNKLEKHIIKTPAWNLDDLRGNKLESTQKEAGMCKARKSGENSDGNGFELDTNSK